MIPTPKDDPPAGASAAPSGPPGATAPVASASSKPTDMTAPAAPLESIAETAPAGSTSPPGPAGRDEPASTALFGNSEPTSASPGLSLVWKAVIGALALATAVGIFLAWTGQQRLKAVEQELIKRQQDLGERAGEARTLARQAEATTRDAATRLAVIEARLAELAVQRTQVDELLRSIIAAREENLLAEIDAALRVAVQHAAITGNLEPLSAALTQADGRLGRSPRPRLELVRLAVAKDLDRLRTASALDLPGMTVRIDEMVRVVDDLPLIATIDRRGVRERRADRPGGSATAPGDTSPAPGGPDFWPDWLDEGVRHALGLAWSGVRDLVRVTRVDDPQAALLAPEQAFFLRENLKLRLLNARLALLSRQFDIARADLAEAGGMIDRYFDKSSRRVAATAEQLRQLAAQAVQVPPPRADATLAALATAMAAR